jgi:hypothetical protein
MDNCINCVHLKKHPDAGKKIHNDDFQYQCWALPMPVQMHEAHAETYHCSFFNQDERGEYNGEVE